MKIIIETSESERVALRPEYQPMLAGKDVAAGSGTGEDIVAIDAGPPSEALLQLLGERERGEQLGAGNGSSMGGEACGSVVVEGMEPSRSRH